MAYGMNPTIDRDASVDRCVCCGSYVPEGKHVCAACSGDLNPKDTSVDDVAMVRLLSSISEEELADTMRKAKKRFNLHRVLSHKEI